MEFNQKPQHISKFKKGDIVTRVEPAIYSSLNENLGIMTPKGKDNSYIGDKLEYIGVANENIYIKFQEGDFKGETGELRYSEFQNGWAYYIDPEKLSETEERMLNKCDAKKYLEDRIQNYSN